jgi:putative phosphoribosyl transferase
VFVVRKLGYPGHEEYAMGAIASGVQVLNPDVGANVPADMVAAVVARERAELARRERLYRGELPAPQLQGRTVIVVDDGLATGSTMRAAVRAIRLQQPERICVAVPVGAAETCEQLEAEADEVVCAERPTPFRAVGLWYDDFPQASDTEVRDLLEAARQERALAAH